MWFREAPNPEQTPEGAVCFLTDADFADDYCAACFARLCRESPMMPAERASWKRIIITVIMQKSVEPLWENLPSRAVGERASIGPSPEAWVVLAADNQPFLRIDVYGSLEPECTTFQAAILWHDWVVIGYGERLHLVSLAGGEPITLVLGDYFGELYPFKEYLLVATGTRLFRLDPMGNVAWKTEWLGVDGVLVSDVSDGMITGRAEHDPPGDWRPFRVDLATGTVITGE